MACAWSQNRPLLAPQVEVPRPRHWALQPRLQLCHYRCALHSSHQPPSLWCAHSFGHSCKREEIRIWPSSTPAQRHSIDTLLSQQVGPCTRGQHPGRARRGVRQGIWMLSSSGRPAAQAPLQVAQPRRVTLPRRRQARPCRGLGCADRAHPRVRPGGVCDDGGRAMEQGGRPGRRHGRAARRAGRQVTRSPAGAAPLPAAHSAANSCGRSSALLLASI